MSSTGGRAVISEGLSAIMRMLSPITPHITQSLWEAFGNAGLVLDAQWPEVDEKALVKDSILLIVQVNGKVRAKLEAGVSASKDELEAMAMADESVQKQIDGKTVRKVIVVPGKLVNIVAN
jgi:leucyl-tRNA synthetase